MQFSDDEDSDHIDVDEDDDDDDSSIMEFGVVKKVPPAKKMAAKKMTMKKKIVPAKQPMVKVRTACVGTQGVVLGGGGACYMHVHVTSHACTCKYSIHDYVFSETSNKGHSE